MSSPDAARCLWCRRALPEQPSVGRRREYCRQSCRQRAYEARRHAEELGLSENELVVTRTELEALQDLAYELQGAVIEVDRTLASEPDPVDVSTALNVLLERARPLVDRPLL